MMLAMQSRKAHPSTRMHWSADALLKILKMLRSCRCMDTGKLHYRASAPECSRGARRRGTCS